MTRIPHVAVVILNWNRNDDTLTCVQSVVGSDWHPLTTIVVDNGSDNDIEPAASSRFPDIIVEQNRENLGFAGGMNVGIHRALDRGAEYVLLLNNDTTVEPSMIRRLVEAAERHPGAGIVSPLVLDSADSVTVTSAGLRFDPRRGHPGRPMLSGATRRDSVRGVHEIDASSGEAMLVSAEAIRQVGPLDSSLFLRLEDVDWSLRMRAAGKSNYVALEACLWHGISKSSGGEHSATNAYYHTRNMFIVCARHAPLRGVRAILRHGEILIVNLIHARRADRPGKNARAVLAAWRDYLHGRLGPR